MNVALSFDNCRLCARACGVNRTLGEIGFCGASSVAHVARIGLHAWEEPIISGKNGSGTIFFSACSLGCVFCQNKKISESELGKPVDSALLAEQMLRLQSIGAHNINFVTPTHYAPTVRDAIIKAKDGGLSIPIVYNTGSYDLLKTIRAFDGLVDIYIPDLKYYRSETAGKYSLAKNYVDTARLAIAEMHRQQPTPVIENGIMKSGVIARILLLPMHVAEAKLSLKYLYDTYGDSIYISLMSQYTPTGELPHPLNRRVSFGEYSQLTEYAQKLGVKNAFIQDIDSASDVYIPLFDV